MSDNLAEDLSAETQKWLGRADDLFRRLAGEERFLENISAYLSDSRYFLEKGDLIRAFIALGISGGMCWLYILWLKRKDRDDYSQGPRYRRRR